MGAIDRISNKWMRTKLDILFGLGLTEMVANRTPRILMYHGVAPASSVFLNHRHITPDVFEQHLRFLAKHAHVVTIEDFFAGKHKPGRKNVLLTFDDGYRNNLQYALPLLEKYQTSAYFYVTGLNQTSQRILWSDLHDLLAADKFTSFIETPVGRFDKTHGGYKPFQRADGMNLHDYLKTCSFEEKCQILNTNRAEQLMQQGSLTDYWQLLSDEEIMQLDRSKYAFVGSHGFYHNNIGNLSPTEGKDELLASKGYLEQLLGHPITSLAYPDGSYSDEALQHACAMGFQYQLAVEFRNQSDEEIGFLKDRVGLYSYETLSMQKHKMIT